MDIKTQTAIGEIRDRKMLPKAAKSDTALMATIPIDAAEPLWKRAPRQDENGRAFADFMMILPKLKHKPQKFIQDTIRKIELVLNRYSDVVVFADFNLKLNVLCVVLKPTSGNFWELAGAINEQVPEARLVAQPHL